MVQTYSLKKDGSKKLSEHFTVSEFACHDGSDKILISDELVTLLEKIRTYFGKPIHINSAYRNATYNKKVGGASASQHVKGTAADIRVDGVPPDAVSAWGEKFNATGGTGRYSTFTHVDVRGYKVLWNGNVSNSAVSSLKLGTMYEKYKAKVEPTPEPPKVELQKEDDEMLSYDKFKTYMKQYEAETAKEAVSAYASADVEWAKKEGILKGDEKGNLMPQSFIKRQDMAVMLRRFAESLEDDGK